VNRIALAACLALSVPAFAGAPAKAGTHPCQQNKPMVEISCAHTKIAPNGYTGYSVKKCGNQLFATSFKKGASVENWPIKHLGFRDYANELGWALSVDMSDKHREGNDQEGYNYPATCINCFPTEAVASASLKSKVPFIAHLTCRVHSPAIPEQPEKAKK
jgi:hypothetical protein